MVISYYWQLAIGFYTFAFLYVAVGEIEMNKG